MRKTVMSPDDDVRIDNLVVSQALLVAEVGREKAERKLIFASLQRIERTLAVPLFYNRSEACKRLGIALSTSYKYPHLLPKPARETPPGYRVSDVEAMALEKEERPRRRHENEESA